MYIELGRFFNLCFSQIKALWSLSTCRQKVPEAGFSLVEVIVATGISGLLVLGTSAIFAGSAKIDSGSERQFWIVARRMEFQGIIRSQIGWNSIVQNNPAMDCFANGTSCSAISTTQTFKLPVDSVVYDGAPGSFGMTNKGDFCTTFDSVNGNSSCPVGIQLNWVALCDDANCRHAQPKITIKFQINEAGAGLQALSSYDLVVYKDPKLDSLNEVCTAMGGTLVGSTCTIGALASYCDPANTAGAGATYPLGFGPTGAVICGKPYPGTCSSSEVATGFDPTSGGLSCAPACL